MSHLEVSVRGADGDEGQGCVDLHGLRDGDPVVLQAEDRRELVADDVDLH